MHQLCHTRTLARTYRRTYLNPPTYTFLPRHLSHPLSQTITEKGASVIADAKKSETWTTLGPGISTGCSPTISIPGKVGTVWHFHYNDHIPFSKHSLSSETSLSAYPKPYQWELSSRCCRVRDHFMSLILLFLLVSPQVGQCVLLIVELMSSRSFSYIPAG